MSLTAQADALQQQLSLVLIPQPVLERYVAVQPVTCCAGCGTLTWWPEELKPENEDDFACPGRLLAKLVYRLTMCWPTPDDSGNFPQGEAEVITAQLVDDLAALSKKVIELQCTAEWRWLRLIDSFTTAPKGGCVSARLEVEIVVS